MSYLAVLLVILIATTLASQISQRLQVPAVLGQLVVGIVVGPAGLKWLQLTHFTHNIAEIGVIFLMFIAGLESDLQLLRRFLKPAVAVAVSGVILPVALFYWTGQAFGFSFEESCFLGVLFAATSVSISVEVLKEMNRLDSREGTTILGAAVLDDILAVLLLSGLVAAFSNLSEGDAPSTNVGLMLGLQVLFFVAVFVAIKYILPRMLHLASVMTINQAPLIIAVISCLGLAYLAEVCGLSDVVGAFFAGVGLAQSPLKKNVVPQVEALGYALFIPVFFVSIGLQMQLTGLVSHWVLIIVFSVLAIATKWLGCGFGAKITGFSLSSADLIGAGMVSRGEMALIIAEIGHEAHLLSEAYYSAIVVVIIITTLVAPFMLKIASRRAVTDN